MGSFLPSVDYPGASLNALGVDEDGKTYARLNYAEESVPGSYQPTARIAVFAPYGNLTSLLEPPAGRYPNGTSGHFYVSPSDEKEGFDEILRISGRAWGLESDHEDDWRSWSGMHSRAGIELVISNLLGSDDRSTLDLSHFYLDETSVPKSVIRQILYEQSHYTTKFRVRGRLIITSKNSESASAKRCGWIIMRWRLSNPRRKTLLARYPCFLIGVADSLSSFLPQP